MFRCIRLPIVSSVGNTSPYEPVKLRPVTAATSTQDRVALRWRVAFWVFIATPTTPTTLTATARPTVPRTRSKESRRRAGRERGRDGLGLVRLALLAGCVALVIGRRVALDLVLHRRHRPPNPTSDPPER